MDTQMKKESNGARAFLGFLLTFLMTIFLIVNALVIGIKTTILNGANMSEVIENLNIYEVLSELISSEISNSTSNDNTEEDMDAIDDGTDVSAKEIAKVATTVDVTPIDNENTTESDSFKISDDAINAIFGEDILKEVTKSITDSIKNNQDVDLSGVKEQCMTNVETLAMNLVDDVIDEIETMPDDTISTDSLKKLNSVQKMKNDYGVDVDTIITDYVKDNHGADSIKVSDVDLEAIRADAKDTVKNDIIPELDKTMDTFIADVSASVNESIKDANATYNISSMINGIESGINTLNVVMIVFIVLIVLFAALQIVVYRKAINIGFRNIFIATLISGIFTLIESIIIGTVKSIITATLTGEDDAVAIAVSKLLTDNIGAIGDRVMLIAIIYLVISIACLVAAIVIKKKINSNIDNVENNGMGTLGDGSVLVE